MLPLVYLRPCAYAIAELTRAYRVTAVLCTATQPALAPIFAHFLQKDASRVFYEICPEDLKRDDMFRRVTFHKTGKLSLEALAAHLNAQKQVLCIVNTRAAAQEVYALLEEEGRFHLSTLMHPDARQKQLARIRERLQQGLRCRVVSTSLIEAGVDVDFPTVFRELAGLDSVLQAAGRCNREGKCPREESCVYVFSSEWKTPPSLEVAVGVCRSVLERGEDLMCEDVIRRYFEAYLFFKGEEAQDSYRILKRLVKSTLPFAEVARDFHLIDSCAVTVYIPTAESYSLIDQYRNGCITRSLMRKL